MTDAEKLAEIQAYLDGFTFSETEDPSTLSEAERTLRLIFLVLNKQPDGL